MFVISTYLAFKSFNWVPLHVSQLHTDENQKILFE